MTFYRLIKESVAIQCTLTLQTNGLKLGPGSSSVTITELLDRVQRYTTQWRNVEWTRRISVPFQSGNGSHLKMFLSGDFLVRVKDDSTSMEVLRFPSSLRGVTEKRWTVRPGPTVRRFVAEPRQDLLVLVERKSM